MNAPSGTITFLFTDIEGSTRLWEQYPEAMRAALARHDALLRQAIEAHNGHVFKTVGDAFCAAFATAPDALHAALTAQCALHAEAWPPETHLRVRMALHTGATEERDGDYFGPPLNRIARLLSTGYGGQVLLSLATTTLLRDSLPNQVSLRDLGLHRLRDLEEPEHVFQCLHPDLRAEFPPLKSLDNLPTNLPLQLSSFIGRTREIEAVEMLLKKARLLTLTGAGGCGKTRLALQVAANVVEAYPDGVWLVELAPLADPAMAPHAVADALGVREEAGRSLLQALKDHLQSKTLLLLLDNCEHLLTACAALAENLLRHCPQVRILATSREPLGVTGEQSYRVPSLDLPPPPAPNAGLRVRDLLDYDSARLFADRPALVKPDFLLSEADAPCLARLCRHLDGIPLAVELAAARMRVLTVEQIEARLSDRFRLLTGGSRTALPRQQTLRALIDWSYDLLTESERTLLRRLSVFAGGFLLEAAESVCGADAGVGYGALVVREKPYSKREQEGNPAVQNADLNPNVEPSESLTPNTQRLTPNAYDVLDLLTGLVDKSLVLFEERAHGARYRLLETIRQYGLERLAESGEDRSLRERHRDFHMQLAEEAFDQLFGPEQGTWLKRLEAEHDNLRAALDFCLEPSAGPANEEDRPCLRLAGALSPFWWLRGCPGEGRYYLDALLSQPGSQAPTTTRMKVLNGAGVLAWMQNDYAAARSYYAASLDIARELNDRKNTAIYLGNLGLVAMEQSDFEAARSYFEEALTINREIGNKVAEANDLTNLANTLRNQGDPEATAGLLEEALAIRRELGDRRGIANVLSSMGVIRHSQGDLEGTRANYEEAVAIYREIDNAWEIDTPLIGLGGVLMEQGDVAGAQVYLAEGLRSCRDSGNKRMAAFALEATAGFLHHQAKPDPSCPADRLPRAACLLGAAESLRAAIGSPLPPANQKVDQTLRDQIRTTLGSEVFERSLEAGRRMDWERAIAYALEGLDG